MTAVPLERRNGPVEENRQDIVRVYVWELPVRITHWLIVLAIAVLSVTGIYIGHPFISVAGPDRFALGWVRAIHSYFAIVFTLSVLARVAWMFRGNRYSHWNKFIPVTRRRWHGLWASIRFYLFILRKPPGFIGHNPLAGLTYVFVFILYFVMIASGFALYAAGAGVHSPMRFFQFLIPLFGGLQPARFIHHIGMWLLLGFAVHHVYSALLMSIVEANATTESILSGHKFVPREDLIYSGYRFVDRKEVHDANV